MKLPIYQVDAFTNKLFSGNPACVVLLTAWLDDNMLLNIAKENAVAETAFIIINEKKVLLRWFTPDIEMDLCGHATLAAAHVLHKHLNYNNSNIQFETKSGIIEVLCNEEMYSLNFPSRKPIECELPINIIKSLSIQPIQVLKDRDYVLVYESESDIRNIEIDRLILDQINLDPGGIVITSIGSDCDFVSRFFTPQSTIFEDPVTGSAHCSLIPYWSEKLNKNEMLAKQLSERGGELYCKNKGNRVIISGQAKTFSEGIIVGIPESQ